MKFRVERDVLADAVTWVARGLPARPPVPVLAGVLIEADEEGSLTLSAFDYEVSARITVPADVAEGGTALVLGRLLAGPDGAVRPAEQRDAATLATTVLAAQAGAWGVRVHDAGPSADAVRTVAAVRAAQRARTRRDRA